MSVIHILIAAAIGCLLAGIGGYLAGRDSGTDAMKAKWDAEKIASYIVAEQARKEIERIEIVAEKEVRKLSDAYTQEIGRRDASLAAARSELARLRRAIPTVPSNRVGTEIAACRSETDGTPAVTGELLSACAGELVEMGGHAERLAGQVISLQDYIRTLQRMN